MLGPVQGPDEAQHVGALKTRHRLAAAQNVHAQRMVGVEQGVKLVEQGLGRIVFVAVHLVEDHLALLGYFALGDRRVLHNVKQQVHGPAVVLHHKAGVKQRVLLARVGV